MYVSFWALNANGTYNVPLPDVQTWELSPVAGSPGAVTIDYPSNGRHFDVLRDSVTQDRDLEIAIWTDGQDTGSRRALLMNADGDDVAEGAVWRFSGHFFEIRMDEDIVQPRTTVVTPPTGPFPTDDLAAFRVYNATAGKIMATLLQESAADNVLSDVTYSFNDVHDSNNAAWLTQITLTISPGTTFTKVLEALVDARMCEWEMAGRELRLYNFDSAGVDRTATSPPIILRSGRSITDSPRKHTVRDSGTTLLVAGDNALYTEVEDATAVARRGRRIRKYASQGSITTLGSLTAYGQAKLPTLTAGQMEIAHGLTMGVDDWWPLRDFDVHDWVWSDTGNGLEKLRVAQATVKGDQNGIVTGGISLNDLIATELEKQAARLAGIEGGTTVTGTSNPAVDPAGGETMAPATPVGLTYTSRAYPVGQEFLSAVFLQWQVVNTNQDGTATSDVAGYRVNYRYTTAPNPTDWQDAGIRYSNSCDLDGLVPGAQMQFRVSCFDSRDNDSGFSTPLTVTTALDGQAPPVPSALTVTEFNGVLILTWNGLGAVGEAMPADFSHVNIHRSQTINFTPDPTTKLDEIRARPGVTAYEGGTYGTLYYFKLTSEDISGNISAPGAQSSGTPLQLVGADLANGIIDASKLGPSAVTLAALANGSVDATKLIDGAVTTTKIAPLAVTGPAIAADTITANNIAANAITASELAANSVVAGKVAANAIGANEITANAIIAGKIAAGAVSTPNLTVGALSDSLIPNGGMEDPDLAVPTRPSSWSDGAVTGTAGTILRDTTTGEVYSGNASVKLSIPNAANGSRWDSDAIPVQPGDLMYIKVYARANRAAAGLRVMAYLGSSATMAASPPAGNQFTITGLNPISLTTTFGAYEGNLTVPALAGGLAPKWMKLVLRVGDVAGGTDTAALDVFVDDVSVQRVIGTAQIADASINTAKIANLAVQDGNIANLNVGKLVSGTGTFTMLMASGNIRSADTGQRFILDPAGLRFFNTAGTMTVDINNTGAANLLTGTVRTGLPGTRRIEVSGVDNEIRYYASSDNTRAARIFSYVPGNFPNDVALELRSIPAATSNTVARMYLLPDQFGVFAAPTVNESGILAGITGSRNGLVLDAASGIGTAQTIFPQARITLGNGAGVDSKALDSAGNTRTRAIVADTGHYLTVEDGTGQRDGGFMWLGRGNAGQTYWGKHTVAGLDSFITIDSGGGMAAYFNGFLRWQFGSDNALLAPAYWGTGSGNGFRALIKPQGGNTISFRIDATANVILDSSEKASAYVKNFVIEHPVDPDRWLVHACTETPEAAIEYSGTAFSGEWGELVEVKLPAYFEAEARVEDRQVWLQPMLNPDADLLPFMPRAIPSYPRDGKFFITSDCVHAGIAINWKVKAVRKDVAQFPVEPLKSEWNRSGDGPYTYLTPVTETRAA